MIVSAAIDHPTLERRFICNTTVSLTVFNQKFFYFFQFHKYNFTSMKTGMKAESKKSKMTGKRYTIDVVNPLASRGKI